MIKSMTGFGRSEYSDKKRNIIVEIKSVNHRYSDITIRMPRIYSFAEEQIKSVIKASAKRGKIEVSITVEGVTESDVDITLNTAVAGQYIEKLNQLKSEFGLSGDVNVEYIASLPDVMNVIPKVEDESELTEALCTAVAEAAQRHDDMRITEGKKLSEDILMRVNLISKMVAEIEVRSPDVVSEYMVKVKNRIDDMLNGTTVATEERILLEAAVFADKVNVTEETVRLNSHLLQLRSIIEESIQPDGKKLDFIVQEMNRETNTIGSKSNDITITNRVLDIKSEIEKIREQVQNIE